MSESKPTSRITFVFVHGAWHGAQHWNHVVPHITKLGYECIALDLPGHGLKARYPHAYFATDRSDLATSPSPVSHVTLEDAADSVIEVLRTLHVVQYRQVVLVGHSMGGNVITRVAEREPQLVQRLVYLSAFMPVLLPTPIAYAALPEAHLEGPHNGLFVADFGTVGAARIDPRSTDTTYLKGMHEAYYGDVDDHTFRAFASSLTPDLPLDYYTASPKATRERWGSIPRTYIRCELDKALAIKLQDRYIQDANTLTPENPTHVESMATSHSPFASKPIELAELLTRQVDVKRTKEEATKYAN
jgi:pimeloyl-ACP methyl ester carboxylesterase